MSGTSIVGQGEIASVSSAVSSLFIQQPPQRTSSGNSNSSSNSTSNGETSKPTNVSNATTTTSEELPHRAIHKIHLRSLEQNYSYVESTANQQRCSVIVVVKADGYGHGSIPTALHLADRMGADAFAVATLEEGIALRKAFQQQAKELFPERFAKNAVNGVTNATNTAAAATNISTATAVAITKSSKSSNGMNGSTLPPGSIRSLFDNPRPPTPPVPSDTTAKTAATTQVASQGYDSASLASSQSDSTIKQLNQRPHASRRPPHVRILVLGPPVGFPRCFDDYAHYSIECMVSGPEVASALKEWVLDRQKRQTKQVERAATETKEWALRIQHKHTGTILRQTSGMQEAAEPAPTNNARSTQPTKDVGGVPSVVTTTTGTGGELPSMEQLLENMPKFRAPSATLSNVTGGDLAKEVRAILMTQQLVAETKQHREEELKNPPKQLASQSSESLSAAPAKAVAAPASSATAPPGGTFAGIEEVAKMSRTRQQQQKYQTWSSFGSTGSLAAMGDEKDAKQAQTEGTAPVIPDGTTTTITAMKTTTTTTGNAAKTGVSPSSSSVSMASSAATTPTTNQIATSAVKPPLMTANRKRPLRWHALVDSGMGRLGFRTDPPQESPPNEQLQQQQQDQPRRDTVEVLNELVQLEYSNPGVLEFYGMQTHMADASNALSNFTDLQVQKFKSLLQRVRQAGISVPTLSIDNSAALLTPTLQHFDPHDLLKQSDGVDTRGFVRVGGAIYGQRPFPQLKEISTLYASVRHVATLQSGESVGYDRVYEAPTSGAVIATITIGFADGYPRELGKGVGKVSIRGHLYPTAGNVCMDMLMVYLGSPADRDGPHTQVKVGDLAILWGPNDDELRDNPSTDGVYMHDDRIVGIENKSASTKRANKQQTQPSTKAGTETGGEYAHPIRLADLAGHLKTTQSALTCGLNKTRVLRQYA